MNYISEINNFHKYTSAEPLSGATQSLWFILMHINNTCGWIEWFRVTNNRLCTQLNMSEKTLIKHRDILIDHGLIMYRSQKRKKNSGEYKMINLTVKCAHLSDETAGNIPVESETTGKTTGEIPAESETTGKTTVEITKDLKTTGEIPVEIQTTGKTTGEIPAESETTGKTTVEITVDSKTTGNIPVESGQKDKTTGKIPDINKHSSNSSSTTTIKNKLQDSEFKKVIDFFNNNFHPISAYEGQILVEYSNHFEVEVILRALQEAVKNGVKSMKYVEGILNNWMTANIKTIQDVDNHMKSFSDKQGRARVNTSPEKKPNSFMDIQKGKKQYTNEELEIKLGLRKV